MPTPKPSIFIIVLLIETMGASLLVWTGLPVFRQLAMHPGQPLAKGDLQLPVVLVAILIMQASYWYRFLRVPIPSTKPSAILHHLFVFLARLSFVFGSGLFSITFFRHLPAFDPTPKMTLLIGRGALLAMSLFSLFCFTLELERLGKSFDE